MHDEIEKYIYGESDNMHISHLTDYKNRRISPSSLLFFSGEDRQEFFDIYEKNTDSAMTELCEIWDNQPSDMWTDEFIELLSGDDSNDELVIAEKADQHNFGESLDLSNRKKDGVYKVNMHPNFVQTTLPLVSPSTSLIHSHIATSAVLEGKMKRHL